MEKLVVFSWIPSGLCFVYEGFFEFCCDTPCGRVFYGWCVWTSIGIGAKLVMHDIVSPLAPPIQFTSFHQIHILAQTISITYYPLKITNTTFSWTTYIHVWMACWFILILTLVKEEDYFYTNSLLSKDNFMFKVSTSHVRIYKSIYTYVWSNHYLT
jgi:hypothetical protein